MVTIERLKTDPVIKAAIKNPAMVWKLVLNFPDFSGFNFLSINSIS